MSRHPLRARRRPAFEAASDQEFALVDLFAGCGGLTLGVAQAVAARGLDLSVRLAVDLDGNALSVYAANFPTANVCESSVETLFDGELGDEVTVAESAVAESTGDVDLLVGGPPCQGHSNLNNHTRRADPKNLLYLRMARAAEVLRPRAVLIENVPSVVHDSLGVVRSATVHLEKLGYETHGEVVRLEHLGVPQLRKRHILLAVDRDRADRSTVQASFRRNSSGRHDLRWAIGDLADRIGTAAFDTASQPSPTNLDRMSWLLENDEYDLPNYLRPFCHQDDHSYKSMYGRLRWDVPAQTITSGFGSIGQGRYMHPEQPRAITPHEAARIQGFPDYFDFSVLTKRTQLSVIIGNAVPPQLAEHLTGYLLAHGVFDQVT